MFVGSYRTFCADPDVWQLVIDVISTVLLFVIIPERLLALLRQRRICKSEFRAVESRFMNPSSISPTGGGRDRTLIRGRLLTVV